MNDDANGNPLFSPVGLGAAGVASIIASGALYHGKPSFRGKPVFGKGKILNRTALGMSLMGSGLMGAGVLKGLYREQEEAARKGESL